MNDQKPNMHSIDYLHSIAPAEPAPNTFKQKIIFIGIALLVIIVASVIFLSSLPKTDATLELAKISSRITKLNKVASKQQPLLKITDLKQINSSLIVSFDNANSGIEKLFNTKEKSKKSAINKIKKSETPDKLNQKFQEDNLKYILDKSYHDEMINQLAELQNMMSQLEKNSKDKQIKEYLTNTIDDFKKIQDQLHSLDEIFAEKIID